MTEQNSTAENLLALAQFLDQSAVIVRQWNGAIGQWTTGCGRLYGWTAEEAVGKTVQDLLKSRYPGRISDIESALRLTGAWQGEVEQVRKDGERVLVSASCTTVHDSTERYPAVVEMHTDITPRLHVQRELEAANRRLASMALELERSNDELEQFARIASHDLSAPITSTRWLVDLLQARHSTRLDENGKKILSQVSQGLDRMSDLVEAVLTHARVGTTAISSLEAVPATEAVAIALENLRNQVETCKASVQFDGLPMVNIDKQTLSQLFQNLLSNAIKYRRPKVAPRVEISAAWRQPLWEFGVADNGIGIEPEWFERIFQPMQRLHGSEIAGSGIGLATCKKIVTRVGGEIWVESQKGVGSRFLFTIPGPAPEHREEQ
jgi:PAS domain S-box-containing protein